MKINAIIFSLYVQFIYYIFVKIKTMSNNKDKRLNIRIDEAMKDDLNRLVSYKDTTISKLILLLLEKEISKNKKHI